MMRLAAALVLAFGLAACAQVGPPAGRMIAIESARYGSIDEVAAGVAVRARTVEAQLIEPAGPVRPAGRAAVVLLEGASRRGDAAYARAFLAEGYAVATVESYRPRGLTRLVGRPQAVPDPTLIADAFGAYSRLREERGIDPTRIALVGLAQGASPALYASFPGIQFMYQAEWPGYAAHVALEPRCGLTLAAMGNPRAPVLTTSAGGTDPCADVMPRAPTPPLYRPAAWTAVPPGITRLQLAVPARDPGCGLVVEASDRFVATRRPADCGPAGRAGHPSADAFLAATAFLRLTIGAEALTGSKLAGRAPPASAASRLASLPARSRPE